MAVDKIYQDSIIAGGAIRDGKGKRIDTNYLSVDSLDSALETKNITTQGNTFNQADTLLKLNSNGKVDSAMLPETVTATPNTATGLSISKVSDTSFSVSAGYCVDATNARVLNLDNTLTKTISIFSEGNNGGSLSSISGDLIPKLTEETDNIISDGTSSIWYQIFDKDESTSQTLYYDAQLDAKHWVGYTFDSSLPAGQYQIYFVANYKYNEGTCSVAVSAVYTDNSEEVLTTADFTPDTSKPYAGQVVLNNQLVNATKPFKAIKFTATAGFYNVYEATIKAPVVTTHSINIAEKEDGTADVFIGNNLPTGFTYMRSIGKIMLNSEGTAITDYFPKTDLATLFSNYDLATKDDIPDAYTKTEVNNLLVDKADVDEIPITTSQLTNDSGFIKSTDIEPTLLSNEDLDTFKTNGKSYYALENTCTNTPTSDAQYGFFLQVYSTGKDPTGRSGYNQTYTQVCTVLGGSIYTRTLSIDFYSLQLTWGSWTKIAKISDIPSAYTLPTASTTTLGGVKVDGSTITISNGVISSKASSSSDSNEPIELTNEDLDTLKTGGKTYYADEDNTCTNKPSNVGTYSKAFGLTVKKIGEGEDLFLETFSVLVQELTFASGTTYTRVYSDPAYQYWGTGDSGGGDVEGARWSNWVLQAPSQDISVITSATSQLLYPDFGSTTCLTNVSSNLTIKISPYNPKCYTYPATAIVQANVTTGNLTLTVDCNGTTVTNYINDTTPSIASAGRYEIKIGVFGNPDSITASDLYYGVTKLGG